MTVDVPLAPLNQVRAETFGWQVPGLREELVTELIRSLPKQLRVNFVPGPGRRPARCWPGSARPAATCWTCSAPS